MKKVLVLFVGGNLLKIWQPGTGNMGYPTGEQKADVAVSTIEKASPIENIKFQTICFKSGNITNTDRQALLEAIETTDADTIVVIHNGGKTLTATAEFLKKNLPADFKKRIALVSSPTPACLINGVDDEPNEARVNLEAAFAKLNETTEGDELTILTCETDGNVETYAGNEVTTES